MAYEKIGFSSGDVLTAVHMNHIEEGIGALDANKLDATALPEAVNTALAQAKESGEFDGYTPVRGKDYWTEEDREAITEEVSNQLSLEMVVKQQGSANVGKILVVGADGNLTLADMPASGGDVVGFVDESKNILLTSSTLPDGTYYFKFEDKYGIVYDLGSATVAEPEPEPAYTNVLPMSVDTDGSVFNGKGYMESRRLGNSVTVSNLSTDTATNPVFVTGYILCPAGATLRFKNCYMDTIGFPTTDENVAYYGNGIGSFNIGCFNTGSFALVDSAKWSTLAEYSRIRPVIDTDGKVRELTMNTSANTYMRFTLGGEPQNAIITINEEIPD